MADTKRLLEAISRFKFQATPSETDRARPCTVGDLNKVIAETAKVLKVFVEELEKP